MLATATQPPDPTSPRRLRIIDLVRPHWKALTIAVVAVLGETLTDILQPWPIKIVVDNILQSKKLQTVLGGVMTGLFGDNAHAMVNFAVTGVAVIAVVGAVKLRHREIPDHKRQPMGSTRPAPDALSPHSAH